MSPLNLEAEGVHFHQLRREKFLVPRPQNFPKCLIRQLIISLPRNGMRLRWPIVSTARLGRTSMTKGVHRIGWLSAELILTSYRTALASLHVVGHEPDWKTEVEADTTSSAFAAANLACRSVEQAKALIENLTMIMLNWIFQRRPS